MQTFLDGKEIWREKVDNLNRVDSVPAEEGAEEMSRPCEARPEGCLGISEATQRSLRVASELATLPSGERGGLGAEPPSKM